jgi:uncharacterized membrane protein YgaE (UPF0421/DUF939 family)
VSSAVRKLAHDIRGSLHAPRGRNAWVDRFLGSDPGLNRLRAALHTVVAIVVTLEAEWLFVHFSGGLQTAVATSRPSPDIATRSALANHEFLVIAMVLGGLIAVMSTFGVTDPKAKGQLVSILLAPVPMIAGLAVGLALGDHRIPSLVVITVVLAVGNYLRRFGPRGTLTGIMLFLGDFLGFFLHVALNLGDLGWLSAEIGVAVLVALGVRFILFFPHPHKALERTRRSYDARARKMAHLALQLFDEPAHAARDARRLHHQLVRLNEAALMIDAQLGDPTAVVDGSPGQLLHQRLFDVELALSNIARFAAAMARLDLPAGQRSEVRLALLGITQRDRNGARSHAMNLIDLFHRSEQPPATPDDENSLIVAHRFAESVMSFTASMTDWITSGSADGDKRDFRSSVALSGGWLPGSAAVSATASREAGSRRGDRFRMAPYTRTAIQMGVAVSGAIFLGVQISSYRFYWAVIAVFITFMGTSNSGEQIQKACHRVGGTVVGIGIGSLLIDVVGHQAYLSIVVILTALSFGLYLMRIGYALMVVGLTVMVAQLYEQLGEFSNSLLLVRLEETALGAAVAIVVVMTVLPLRTQRVLRIALRNQVEAVDQLVEHATAGLLGNEIDIERMLRADARVVDAANQALLATARPLKRSAMGNIDESVGKTLRLAAAVRHYAANLVVDVIAAGPLDSEARPEFGRASASLRTSVGIITGALSEISDETYTRSAALFDRVALVANGSVVARHELTLQDLKLLDGALAEIAEGMGLRVTDHDTVYATNG